MDVKEIKKLLDAMKGADVSELTLETGEVRLTARRDGETRVVHAAAAHAEASPRSDVGTAGHDAAPTPAPASQSAQPPATGAHLVEVTAPIVGTFYESPGPDASPYVKVGDHVAPGAVLCIIEAMKLMNEIEAETSGTIAEILVRDEEPVEYGQTLFRIDPD